MKFKRFMTAGLTLCLAASVAGCSDNGEKSAENGKMTITAMKYIYGDPPPIDGPGLKKINEKFKVDYQPRFIPEADYDEKLTAVMASGDVPDIVGFKGFGVNEMKFYTWAKQGAFLPLDEYIKDYPTFKMVPDYAWDAMKVDGKIYGIPEYSPVSEVTPVIRKDWLDKLGLKMPTNYEELKKVAIAFTKQDPDGNGKDDTYGIAMGQNIDPDYNMGAYWDYTAWYHKNEQGRYIPGIISDARKQLIQFYADLYKEGALTRDFALMSWGDVNSKEFYAGKAGIFIAAPQGMSEPYMQSLLQVHPEAELVPIPPFQAPDGSKGFRARKPYFGMTALSAKLADQPEKVKRILEMIDFGRKFYPWEERTPDNKDFDWLWGHQGEGYVMKGGKPVAQKPESQPRTYLPDKKGWAPSLEANRYSMEYNVPQLANLTRQLEQMHVQTKHYFNPVNGIIPEIEQQKGEELRQFLINEQTKMIVGQRPIDEWDQMVQEFLNKGGAQWIKEMNEAIQAGNRQGFWK
ncbi:extracellular solute-binding protein [Lihuaxuella thermophila]|uniref:Putative aldouronate transport system substrate-binding protein n=1 Tax=Lihuaxuella thermophila TaxID=1173111 RepID=A0A1H8CIY2_9BACL|nr:extracellular solute-binding protein [Lihuaxuella thermophila]SEM94047.1 putative aldouronate transport system substrate-binding protein [Lihuaxuella thermophila]